MRPGGGPGGMFAAGPPVTKSLNFKGSARRLLGLLRPERPLMLAVLAFAVASVTLNVLGPKVLGNATDVIFSGYLGKQFPAGVTKAQAVAALRQHGENRTADVLQRADVIPGQGIDFSQLGRILFLALALYVFASLLAWIQGRITTIAVQRSVYRLRRDVNDKLTRLPLSYYDDQPRGEILSKTTNDIDNIGQTLQQTLAQLINAVLLVVGVLVMMFWISWVLAIIALVTVPLSGYVAARIGKVAQPNFVSQWSTTGRLNGHIEEMYTGHSLVKVFGRQAESSAKFAEHNEKLFRSSFKAQFVSGLIQPAMMFLGNVNYVLVAVVGALRVANGTMSLGDVQAFIQYSRQFTQPMMQVAAIANLLQSGVASAERVFELLDAPEQSPDPVDPAFPAALRGRVAFDHVSFRYQRDEPLIDDLSLAVEPGQMVAIVGPTGAGKTTLVNLLMRFYEVTSGRITLDGVDIATMSREQLRETIGMVLQDTWLFGGSIEDNIAYGGDGVSPELLREAAVATHVDHFARTLPDGYGTVIDEEGTNLSAGEKQLVTIARAFVSEPTILVLDEATSSVDTRTEVLIQRAMNSLRSGRTSFVIAHRLSTIRDADVILVMEDGAIVEQGTHDELLTASGAYSRLYAAQFAAAAADIA